MDIPINIDLRAVSLAASIRPRDGASPQANGQYAPEDTQIVLTASVGVTKVGALAGPDGKIVGQMVPVAIFADPIPDFLSRARRLLGAQDAAADQQTAKDLRAGLSLT